MTLPAWQPHPEVWLLLVGLGALAWYAVGVIGPKVVEPGTPVATRRQVVWFTLGMVTLWVASDWPMHDVSEEQLYTVHMVQHFLLTMVVSPLFLLAIPEWLAGLVVTDGGTAWRWLRRLAHPVTATVIFNVATMATHYTAVVNTSVKVGPFHYLVHVLVVASAVIMWIPVCGPWRVLRIRSAPATMVYLFIQSIVPTVPSAWLTLAEGPVYEAYDHLRLWDITTVEDQQAAGLVMKVVTGGFLWMLIVVIFFRWATQTLDNEHQVNLLSEEQVRVIEARQPASTTSTVSGSGLGPEPSKPPIR